MNDRGSAEKIRDLSLQAVSRLSEVLSLSRSGCSEQEYERFRKGVGLAIGQIQAEILDPIYSQYPDLNHLK
jgi:hypothetical protein